MKELQYLNPYFSKYKLHFLSGIIITIVAQIFMLYTPELIGESIAALEKYVKSGDQDIQKIKSLL